MPQVCCNLYLSGRHCVSWLMWSPASGDSLGKKGLQVRLMLLWENMVFLDNTDIQGASFYSLEALTIKMLCFIQSYIKSSLAEATGRFRVWGTSALCLFLTTEEMRGQWTRASKGWACTHPSSQGGDCSL